MLRINQEQYRNEIADEDKWGTIRKGKGGKGKERKREDKMEIGGRKEDKEEKISRWVEIS